MLNNQPPISHHPLGTHKTISKKAIQKIAVATGDLIGNKSANKITKKYIRDS